MASLSSSSSTPSSQPVGLSDFVNSVPSPLTFALVSLSDEIALLKSALQVLNWRSKSWFDGFVAVAAWWAFCRFSGPVLRYCLPISVLGVVYYAQKRRSQPSRPPVPVVTETLIQNAIADLTSLPVLLPSLPSTAPLTSLSIPEVLRAVTLLYVPYLALTHFIPLHLIFAIAGTLILTWRAPFAVLIRRVAWGSAFVRWGVWTAWSYISGRPLPPKTISPQTQNLSKTEKVSSEQEKQEEKTQTNSLRFLFTVYENQRWWMGLDWTAALLPGERPSWCSASQAPLSPPGAFTLPEPATTYVPHPSCPNKKIKKTAEWYWEEPEWRVLVKKEGNTLSRVERPVPTEPLEAEEVGSTANNTGTRLFKAASSKFGAAKDRDSVSLHRRDSSSATTSQQDPTAQEVVEGSDEDTDGYTDPDGWIYGDNKWESKSNKGGMSKYTRYRRWTRVAVLTEFTEVVDATPDTKSDRRPKGTRPPPMILQDSPALSNEAPASAPVATGLEVPKAHVSTSAPNSTGGLGADGPLKQRLRMALNKGTNGNP